MALKGTLKDFGIADIFQLIGHQAKTGTLFLLDKGEEVAVSFVNGNVVTARNSSRKKKDLLGRMLTGAALLTQEQLDEALEHQKKTLTRLGDILVERQFVSREELRQITQLQVTETIYKLFSWKSGTYEFVQQEVEYDEATQAPIRSETILMDGFRMVDEWPMVQKTITSLTMTFLKAKELPAGPREGEGEDDFDFQGGSENKKIGKSERRVWALVGAGKTVQDVIDRSRLGEFETCKALHNLTQQGFLTAIQGKGGPGRVGEALAQSIHEPLSRLATRAALTLAIAALLTLVVSRAGITEISFGARTERLVVDETGRWVGGLQAERLVNALEIFRLENKEYPVALDELVKGPQALVQASDLRYPWTEQYFYKRTADGYVLLPPLR